MAKSRKEGGPRWRKIPLVIPALVIVAAVILYVIFTTPPIRPVVDFSTNISIQVSHNLSNGTMVLSYFTPPPYGIGIPGGVWRSNALTRDGLQGRYPLYMLPPPSNYPGFSPIYVRSTVNRTYTLGDFFTVWGEQLGRNNTLGFTSPPQSGQTNFGPGWYWDMCVGTTQGTFHEGLWGNETLTPGKNIILSYSDASCANPRGG